MSTSKIPTDETFTVEIPFKVTVEHLTDLLITAIEGGISYWCPKIRFRTPGECCDHCGRDITEEGIVGERDGVQYFFDRPDCLDVFNRDKEGFKPRRRDVQATTQEEGEGWNEFICRNVAMGGTLTLTEDCGEGDAPLNRKLTRDKLLNGIRIAVVKYAHVVSLNHFDHDGWMGDAEEADVILQCALFGEEGARYG
jgi:hypothetical protein